MNPNKNILSSDVEIKGSLKFSNDLIIDGRIEGEVTSDGSLTVGENALVIGEILFRSLMEHARGFLLPLILATLVAMGFVWKMRTEIDVDELDI